MKRLLATLAAIVCCSMISTVFTACSDDDDNNSGDNMKPVAAILYYNMNVGDDMFAALDLTIEYYDADGKLQSEKMTAKEWEKNIRTQKLPATLGARLKAQLKAGFDVTSGEKFIAEYGYGYWGGAVNAAGEAVSTPAVNTSAHRMTMRVGEIAEWLERHPDGIVKFKWNIDANGKTTEGDWSVNAEGRSMGDSWE